MLIIKQGHNWETKCGQKKGKSKHVHGEGCSKKKRKKKSKTVNDSE